MPNRETLNTYFSLLALVISAGAFVLSYFDFSAKKESLTIVANPLKNGYDLQYVDFVCPEICGVARTQWELVVHNTSDRAVTVDAPTVEWLSTEVMQYTYLKGRTFIDNKLVDFPISIDPGKHVKLIQEIGVPISEKALKLLKRDYSVKKTYPIQEVLRGLALERIDLFDNEVRYIEFIDGSSIVEANPIFNPTFSIGFSTGRAGKFEGVGKWY